MNLTPKQLWILKRIRDWRLANGYSPTMQELADELNVSKVTVFEHVESLIKKGALIRTPNKARSLDISPNLELPDEQRHTRLPLVGAIAAGSPIEAVEDVESIDLEAMFAQPSARRTSRPSQVFALKVRGNSMIDEHIRDGDFVVCQKADNGEATLKKLYRERGKFRLQPANDKFEPIIVDHCQVQGVVIGVIRTY